MKYAALFLYLIPCHNSVTCQCKYKVQRRAQGQLCYDVSPCSTFCIGGQAAGKRRCIKYLAQKLMRYLPACHNLKLRALVGL
jgi:hypothetical protein